MIAGTTKSGFNYSLNEEVLDDYELLEDLSDVDRGDISKITVVAKQILGDKQLQALKDHIRNEKGKVPMKKMFEEIEQILGETPAKNS